MLCDEPESPKYARFLVGLIDIGLDLFIELIYKWNISIWLSHTLKLVTWKYINIVVMKDPFIVIGDYILKKWFPFISRKKKGTDYETTHLVAALYSCGTNESFYFTLHIVARWRNIDDFEALNHWQENE